MNDSNLKSNDSRTPQERRENARKAGQASGKARRKKADLRKLAQAFLDDTFTTSNNRELTGSEIVFRSILLNISNPSSRNWGRAVQFLIDLTGAGESDAERGKREAETELYRARAAAIQKLPDADETKEAIDNLIAALNVTAVNDWNNLEKKD